MEMMNKQKTQQSGSVRAKKSAKRRMRPFTSALICAVVGLGAGTGGGYLAVKNFMPEPQVIYQTADAASVSEESAMAVTVAANTAKSIQDVIEEAGRSVVEIEVESTASYGMFGGSYTATGAGSGVIISDDGYIITNNHVIEGAEKVTVTMHDGTVYNAEIIGSDEKEDIGVIRVQADNLDAAAIGDSDAIRVGDTAIVIGNPLGTLGGTVTNGIISAVNREMTINNETMNLIQTNAAINNGNSGGGLFSAEGRLIGIVNAKDSGMTSSGAVIEGLGFAIPINTAIAVANDIIEHGHVTDQASIGVQLQTLERDYNGYQAGLYIAGVYEGGAAEAAGLRAGDRIIMADGQEIETYAQLSGVLDSKHVGDAMTLTVERDGTELEFTLTLTGVLQSMRQY